MYILMAQPGLQDYRLDPRLYASRGEGMTECVLPVKRQAKLRTYPLIIIHLRCIYDSLIKRSTFCRSAFICNNSSGKKNPLYLGSRPVSGKGLEVQKKLSPAKWG